MATTRTRPEAHPNYRPPIDVPCIVLDEGNGGLTSCRRQELRTGQQGSNDPFVVSNLLSKDECNQIINLAESADCHLQKVDWEYVPSYRDCSRAVVRCSDLTSALFQRLLPFLSTKECETVRPYGFDCGDFGEWRPLKLNSVLRISRYDQGGHFSKHKDGAFVENDDVRSVYTVLVYLNESPAFEGGDTHLYLSSSQEEVSDDKEMESKKLQADEVVKVVPTVGSALVMLHDTLHSGEPVISGRKYICRLDIMFQRLGGGMTLSELELIPARIEAERLYASSIVKQRDGDTEGSTRDYLLAQNLQARLPSSSITTDISSDVDVDSKSVIKSFNEDLLVRCFRFLTTAELCGLSLVSKRFKALASNSLLWREQFLLRWPALVRVESIVDDEVVGNGRGAAIPVAIHEPRTVGSGWWSYETATPKKYCKVYATILSSKPKLYDGGQEKMNGMYSKHRTSSFVAPSGYMFSGLVMCDFGLKERRKYRNWVRLDAVVNEASIYFAHPVPDDMNMASVVPQRIPLLSETKIMFASGDYEENSWSWVTIDCCILEIPGCKGLYLALCTTDPSAAVNSNRYWRPSGFNSILDDISRVLVARQTEQALRYDHPSLESVAVRCDAKTKQWKTAYSRRHLAEKFFDVVSVDIGSRRAKFTSSGCDLETLLSDFGSWSSHWYEGVCYSSLDDAVEYFLEAAKLYRPQYLLQDIFVNQDGRSYDKQVVLKNLVAKGVAKELRNAACQDLELESALPRPILEAEKGCGSIVSLVANAFGHLWSAKHGQQNHLVGEGLEDQNAIGPYNDASKRPDMNVVGIIISFLVSEGFVRRPTRSPSDDRRTCAEHPINVVEPALGFSELERMELIQTLSGWNVPFVGFVNGAVAALMCGATPKRNGIVAMVGGTNSSVALVKDGTFVEGIPLLSYDTDEISEDAASKEVSDAIEKMLDKSGGAGIDGPTCVLLTGGRATDSLVMKVKNTVRNTNINITVASPEKERHLDAVRGAQVLACLSDSRKNFVCIMNHMWAVQVPSPAASESGDGSGDSPAASESDDDSGDSSVASESDDDNGDSPSKSEDDSGDY